MSAQKLAHLAKLKNQTSTMQKYLGVLQQQNDQMESSNSQGSMPNGDARSLKHNIDQSVLGPALTPGNVGDINKVIWPFYFTTEVGVVTNSGGTLNTGYNVTQEAAFVMMSYTKSIYSVVDDVWTYLNPDDETAEINKAPGLKFTLKDGSSQRAFQNLPIDLAHYGNPRFPSKLPRGLMFLPNQNVQIQFTNMNTVNDYMPRLTFFGYRIRIDYAQEILSLVYG